MLTCARILKHLAHVNVLGKEIACWAALHLTRMIGRELSSDHVVRPRGCNEANPHRRGPLAWLRQRSRRAVTATSLRSLSDAICPLQMPRSNDLVTTVSVARQDSGCRMTRARRTYTHIRTQSCARARAVKTQPEALAPPSPSHCQKEFGEIRQDRRVFPYSTCHQGLMNLPYL